MNSDERKAEAVVADAMALFSSLTTVAEVWMAVRERRQGRDPSGQEAPDAARRHLREARRELLALLVRLNASYAHAEDAQESYLASLVRRGSDLMLLQRAERLLQLMHQRLMSLYPEIPEALVEEARTLRREADRLLDPEIDAQAPSVPRFVQQAATFCDNLFMHVR